MTPFGNASYLFGSCAGSVYRRLTLFLCFSPFLLWATVTDTRQAPTRLENLWADLARYRFASPGSPDWSTEAVTSTRYQKKKRFRILKVSPVTRKMPGTSKDMMLHFGPLITESSGHFSASGCVEVACMVDAAGVHPTRYGALPPQMAALCAANMRMFDIAAVAAIEKSKEAAILALMLDPLTAAVCSPAEIKTMTLELFEAEAEFLPDYK